MLLQSPNSSIQNALHLFFLSHTCGINVLLYLYPDEVWRRSAKPAVLVVPLVLAFMPRPIITRAVIFFEVVVVTVFVYFIVCLQRHL